MFEPVRYTNTAQQIVSQIRNAIFKGILRPGDKLPPEKSLVDEFQVSKQTLKEALRALECLGLIRIKKGVDGGPIVSEVDMEITTANLVNFLHFRSLSVEHVSAVRIVVEPYCAKVAAEAILPEDLEKLKLIVNECKELLKEGYSSRMTENEINFHRIIATTTRNPIMILILDFVENLLQDIKNILRPPVEFSKSVIESHERIYDAIAARDPERAYQEMFKDVTEVGAQLSNMVEKPII